MKRPRHVIRSQNSSDSLPMEDEHHPLKASLAERTNPSWGPFAWTHRTLSAASSLQTPIEAPHSKQNQQPQQFAISRQRPAPLQSFSFDGFYQSPQQRPPLSASSSSSSTASSPASPIVRTPSSDNLKWRGGSNGAGTTRKRSSPRSGSFTGVLANATPDDGPTTRERSPQHGALLRNSSHSTTKTGTTTATAVLASNGATATSPSNLLLSNRPSFRRQKKRRRHGFCHLVHSRGSIRRLFVYIVLLFVGSFVVAFGISHWSLLVDQLSMLWRAESTPRLPQSLQHQQKRQLPFQTAAFPWRTTPRFLSHPRSLSPRSVGAQDVAPGRLRASHAKDTSRHTTDHAVDAAKPSHPHIQTSKSKDGASPQLRRRKVVADSGASSFARFTAKAPSCRTPLAPDQVEFTVVTQLSLNRLWMMQHHCARWKHAISIAVYVGNNEHGSSQQQSQSRTPESIRNELVQTMGCTASLLSVQTVAGYSDEEYPVNVLRNTALAAVQTSHVVYVDVDFWESTSLFDQLQRHVEVLASDPKLALVLPAFAMARQCREYEDCREDNVPRMPHTKNDLIDLLLDHQASAFDPSNAGGHGSTRYKEWLVQGDDELLPIECIQSNRYEPYLVVRHCHDLPPFQPAFTGYGKNKMTWMMQLRRTGYKFWQLGGAFVVHYPHLDSTARLHWNGGADGAQLKKPRSEGAAVDWAAYKRGQIDQTFVAFRQWLTRTVPDEAVVPLCENALNDDERLWIDPATTRHDH
jgi:Glycosyl-transferase for dystroglycan